MSAFLSRSARGRRQATGTDLARRSTELFPLQAAVPPFAKQSQCDLIVFNVRQG